MKKKIIGSFVCLFLLFSMGAIVAPWYTSSTLAELSRLVELHRVEGLRRDLIISMQTVQADLYTTRTVLGRRLDEIVESVSQLEDSAEQCTSCHHSAAVRKQLDRVDELIDDYQTALSYYITASANRDRIDRIQIEGAAIGKQILDLTGEMSAAATGTLVNLSNKARSRMGTLRVFLLATLVLAFCLSVLIASFLVRSVTRPVAELVRATRTIASGGLGYRIEEEMETEFGELADHFNEMSVALKRGYEGLESANKELQREIVERKQAERERAMLQEQLLQARKMQAVGTLSAGIAHEFNNYLHVIQGCVEKLSLTTDAPGREDTEIRIIDEVVRRGADLTRQLLAFSSDAQSRPVPIDMSDMVQRTKAILERALPRTIEVRLSLAEGSGKVSADPAKIEQVLLNLALNARDAMPDGGILCLETGRVNADTADTETSAGDQGGDWVVLKVSDTGHGMDEETLQRVFEPFFTTREVGGGTGLGLATAYGIVTGYGGRITCSSEVGKGTVFEILLPRLADKSEKVEAGAPSSAEVDRGHGSILLVDDEPRMLEVTGDALGQHGYVVHSANSGGKAIEFFERHGQKIDLVVLDLRMPGMDGRACLERLLKIKPDAKIVITTGYGTQEQQEKLMEAGAFGFLTKPYRVSEIASKIKAARNS